MQKDAVAAPTATMKTPSLDITTLTNLNLSPLAAARFDPLRPVAKKKPLIKDFLWEGVMGFFCAQSGDGKSLLVEYMATCLKYGADFMGIPTMQRSVMMIDEDTPTDELHARLQRFNRYVSARTHAEKRCEIYVLSHTGLKLSDGSLLRAIRQCKEEDPELGLVIIDSLNSCLGNLRINDQSDMSILSHLHKLADGLTILVVHHVSDKKIMSIAEFMACDAHTLPMGSSAIDQNSDDNFFLKAYPNDKCKKAMRISDKRIKIDRQNFTFHAIEDAQGDIIGFEMDEEYREPTPEVDLDVLNTLKMTRRALTVGELYDSMGRKHGVHSVRESVRRLTVAGRIKFCRSAHNLNHFSLCKKRATLANLPQQNAKNYSVLGQGMPLSKTDFKEVKV
jgi:hypothetical protein